MRVAITAIRVMPGQVPVPSGARIVSGLSKREAAA